MSYPRYTRAEAIKLIKEGLKKRTGRPWSVTGGRGTAYGWITITAVKKYAVNGNLSESDQTLLAKTLGLEKPVHFQGVSIPAGFDYRAEYVARSCGETPPVYGRPYWD